MNINEIKIIASAHNKLKAVKEQWNKFKANRKEYKEKYLQLQLKEKLFDRNSYS